MATHEVDPKVAKILTNVPGIDLPRLRQPDEIQLPDDAEVIGVEINGTFRA